MAEAVSDEEIYRSAAALIRNHGPRAEAEARAQVESWTRQGAPEGAAVWRRILAAVRELQGGKVAGGRLPR